MLLVWKFHIYSLGTSWFSICAAPAGPNTLTKVEPDVCEHINIMFLSAVHLRQLLEICKAMRETTSAWKTVTARKTAEHLCV